MAARHGRDFLRKDSEPTHNDGNSTLQASRTVSLVYLAIAAGNAGLLWAQISDAELNSWFPLRLGAVQICLAFEALVFAAGDISCWQRCSVPGMRRAWGLGLLEFAGRLRLLSGATLWGWLLPWSTELGCRCGTFTGARANMLMAHAAGLAGFTSCFFALREFCVLLRGEPPSAVDPVTHQRKFGDCLPSHAVLGGHFQVDKADLEQTGRIVFVPGRARSGLHAGAGLALLGHLGVGLAMLRAGSAGPPWLFLGAVGALCARRLPVACKGYGADGALAGDEEAPAGEDAAAGLRRADLERIICFAGELWWMWCCVCELQRCTRSSHWRLQCAD